MKTAGLIGGIGPESTIEYYRQIIAASSERADAASYPRLIVNSIDVNWVLGQVNSGRLRGLADSLLAGLDSLSRAGADFGALTAYTPHVVFDELRRRSP